MTLEAYKFYDPATHIKYESEKSCNGCAHLETAFSIRICMKKPMIRPENLKRCNKYGGE